MKFFYGFLLAGALAACSPATEHTPVFPRYFVGDKITVASPVRLLVQGQEIKDPALIQSFVNRHSVGSAFSFENTPIQGDTALVLSSTDTLRFSFVPGIHTVKQDGKEWDILGPKTSDDAYQEELERFFSSKSLRTLVGDEWQLQRVYKAYGDYDYLELPVLSYFFKSSKGYTYGGGRAYTELDESSARELPAGDTLVVKAYRLGLKAK
ncbi:hypothetical protein [Siphonobacter sp.]|uniref:hypothetical protein n=1 Tax=Siphonobacter sp. TaxID=1869184 RepID=UPI003B3A22D4